MAGDFWGSFALSPRAKRVANFFDFPIEMLYIIGLKDFGEIARDNYYRINYVLLRLIHMVHQTSQLKVRGI